jgi:AcrR family transcriptional regulator
MENIKPSIQEQLVEARKTQILDAATKVFAEKGFTRATVKDVAQEAGIANGTIYNYFENKTALLLGILHRFNTTSERQEHFEIAVSIDPKEFFVMYLKQRMKLLAKNYEMLQATLPEILVNPEIRDIYYKEVVEPTFKISEAYFQAQINKGVLEPVDVELLVRVLSSTTFGLLIFRMFEDKPLMEKWEQLPEIIAKLVFEGLTRREPHDSDTHQHHQS